MAAADVIMRRSFSSIAENANGLDIVERQGQLRQLPPPPNHRHGHGNEESFSFLTVPMSEANCTPVFEPSGATGTRFSYKNRENTGTGERSVDKEVYAKETQTVKGRKEMDRKPIRSRSAAPQALPNGNNPSPLPPPPAIDLQDSRAAKFVKPWESSSRPGTPGPASIPFKWEEAPGVPKPNIPALKPLKSLQLPPRLLNPNVCTTSASSPSSPVDRKGLQLQKKPQKQHLWHGLLSTKKGQNQNNVKDFEAVCVSSPTSIFNAMYASTSPDSSKSSFGFNRSSRESLSLDDEDHTPTSKPARSRIPSIWNGPVYPCIDSPYRNFGPSEEEVNMLKKEIGGESVRKALSRLWSGNKEYKKDRGFNQEANLWEPTLADYYRSQEPQLIRPNSQRRRSRSKVKTRTGSAGKSTKNRLDQGKIASDRKNLGSVSIFCGGSRATEIARRHPQRWMVSPCSTIDTLNVSRRQRMQVRRSSSMNSMTSYIALDGAQE